MLYRMERNWHTTSPQRDPFITAKIRWKCYTTYDLRTDFGTYTLLSSAVMTIGRVVTFRSRTQLYLNDREMRTYPSNTATCSLPPVPVRRPGTDAWNSHFIVLFDVTHTLICFKIASASSWDMKRSTYVTCECRASTDCIDTNEEVITAAVERQPCRGPGDNAQKIRTITNGGHQRMLTYGKMRTRAILTTTSRLRLCGLNLRAGVQTATGWTLRVRFLSRLDFSPCYGIQTSARFHLSFYSWTKISEARSWRHKPSLGSP